MRLQRYDYQTREVEPIDLSGSQLKFNIYKPNYEIDLSLINNSSGKEFKKTISLSEEENQELLKCTTDEERQAFLNSLPSAKEALHHLAIEAGLDNNSAEMEPSSKEEGT